MKYIFLLFVLSFVSLTSYAQKSDVEEYTDRRLSSSVDDQQGFFKFIYSFYFEMMHEDQHTSKNGTRTLQVMKNAIQDTIKPFFNTVLVNEQTLAGAKKTLKEESKLQYLMNSELFTKGAKAEELKAYKGSVKYNVTDFPYQKFLQVYSNVTSVADASGKNLLVSGKDTILSTRSISKWDGGYLQSADFTYDNTEHPTVLLVSGTVTIKVPSKFLIITFLSSEVGKSKVFQKDTFTLKECAAGKVIVSAPGEISDSEIRLVPVGPSNVEYQQGNGFSGGVSLTDEFIYTMINDHDTRMNSDTILSAYFDRYVDYLKNGPVKLMTIYSSLNNRGNIEKVYIVKPLEYVTITESFSIESKE